MSALNDVHHSRTVENWLKAVCSLLALSRLPFEAVFADLRSLHLVVHKVPSAVDASRKHHAHVAMLSVEWDLR